MLVPTLSLTKVKGTTRVFLFMFVFCLSFGYATGLYYISISSGFTVASVSENYLGNEDDEEAELMKFKMKEKEVLSIIHSHVVSFSLMFLTLGFLLFQSSFPSKLISVLTIEPFISIILTFGGIWFLWKGVEWAKYIILLSGTLMHIIFIAGATLVLVDLLRKRVA
jgi:hypothetical protein